MQQDNMRPTDPSGKSPFDPISNNFMASNTVNPFLNQNNQNFIPLNNGNNNLINNDRTIIIAIILMMIF